MSPGDDLVFVGDVHLDRDDEHLEGFLAFLESLRPTVGRLVFMGDLFNVWIGRRDLEQPHQRAVLERLEAMRRDGVSVRYIEGNRDYRIAEAYAGRALDESTTGGVALVSEGPEMIVSRSAPSVESSPNVPMSDRGPSAASSATTRLARTDVSSTTT